MTPLPQEKRLQSVLRLRAHPHGVFARAHEIAHRFIRVVWHIDRPQFAGTMQPRQRHAVPPIGLHTIAAAFGHHRRTYDDARLAAVGQIAVDAEAAGARLVHEMQPTIRRPQRAHDLVERFEIARDHPIMAHFAVAVALRDRHVDRFLVDIEAHGHATVLHDLPPRVWHGAKRQTLRIIHDVTRG